MLYWNEKNDRSVDPEALEVLLGWYDEEPPSPLHRAVGMGEVDVVRSLIAQGADANALVTLRRRIPRGQVRADWWDNVTPLMVAVAACHLAPSARVQVATVLMDAGGATVDLHAGSSDPPLYMAARYGDEAMVRFLVERGADVNGRGSMGGGGPLEAAIRVGSNSDPDTVARTVRLVTLLLDAGADPNLPNGVYGYGGTPLNVAVGRHPDILRTLLQRGSHPDGKPGAANYSYTPLGQAVIAAHWYADPAYLEACLAAIPLLADAGADVEAAYEFGQALLVQVSETAEAAASAEPTEWPEEYGEEPAPPDYTQELSHIEEALRLLAAASKRRAG
jgi:hypothetical protein